MMFWQVIWHLKKSFSAPRAPNIGGLWEAGVKSFKYYLKRVVGNLKLTFEEFNCIVIQIERMLNSSPLFPLISEIDEIEVLTPAHFLIGRPLYPLIEPDLTNINENRLKSWHKITRVFQFIWKKWSNDYLNNLQERNKWMFCKNNVKIRDMVLVKEDNLPHLKWSIGKFGAVFPGVDNKIRVAEIKTAFGRYKRPISKLCLLPMNE
ncbi:hypothetical protein AVEN_214444-1 [Araneus ventricosus]|uniref:DUF5641 domain-containing protein n=1 Tax=Araneus ventricosus TaxID=182803 RepID=A0A4Y2SI26_ARAVE|nr:hypothetical protein AVEN_214444-1 [Araneus ventricosus]